MQKEIKAWVANCNKQFSKQRITPSPFSMTSCLSFQLIFLFFPSFFGCQAQAVTTITLIYWWRNHSTEKLTYPALCNKQILVSGFKPGKPCPKTFNFLFKLTVLGGTAYHLELAFGSFSIQSHIKSNTFSFYQMRNLNLSTLVRLAYKSLEVSVLLPSDTGIFPESLFRKNGQHEEKDRKLRPGSYAYNSGATCGS